MSGGAVRRVIGNVARRLVEWSERPEVGGGEVTFYSRARARWGLPANRRLTRSELQGIVNRIAARQRVA